MAEKTGPIVTELEPLRVASTPYQLIMLAASTGCGLKLKPEQVRALAGDSWIQWRAGLDRYEAAERMRLWRK